MICTSTPSPYTYCNSGGDHLVKKKNEKANKSAEQVEQNDKNVSAEQGEKNGKKASAEQAEKNGKKASAEKGKKRGPGGIGLSASNENCWE